MNKKIPTYIQQIKKKGGKQKRKAWLAMSFPVDRLVSGMKVQLSISVQGSIIPIDVLNTACMFGLIND